MGFEVDDVTTTKKAVITIRILGSLLGFCATWSLSMLENQRERVKGSWKITRKKSEKN